MTATVEAGERLSATGRGYARYALFLLLLANLVNSADRSIVNVLVEPIRRDLGFNDTEIGLVAGLGFALFYGILGLPIARLADRTSRKRLLAFGLAAWSTMTLLTGRATGFWTMLLARFGVGAGESTCYPVALSLIGDYFPAPLRPRAISIFQIGLHGGFIMGAATAGLVADRYGWRSAFVILGLPGLVIALLVALTMREPARGTFDQGKASALPIEGLYSAFSALVADRVLLLLAVSSTFMSIAAATMATWGSAYLMRSHGLSASEVGVTIGPVVGIGGALGTLAGGFIGTQIAKHDHSPGAPLKAMIYTALPGAPCMALFVLAPTVPIAVIGGLLGGILSSIHYGPLVGTAINRADPSSRALCAAMLVIGQTVVGFGFGPLIAGALSDLLAPTIGLESLRYAMLIAPVAVCIAWALALNALRLINAETPGAEY